MTQEEPEVAAKMRAKWLLLANLANVTVAILLILVIYSMMLALAAFAAEVTTWPFFTLLLLGLVLSVVGLKVRAAAASRGSRRVACVIHGGAFAFYLLILAGLGVVFLKATQETFLIPNGYRGDVYILHGVNDGQPIENARTVTYRIPENGILHTRGAVIRNWTMTKYYYQLSNGHMKRISNLWLTTIERTPENLANDRDIGVFFPRTGIFTDANGCSVEYDQFYVGTKAHLLTNYKQTDIREYLHSHPVNCTGQSK